MPQSPKATDSVPTTPNIPSIPSIPTIPSIPSIPSIPVSTIQNEFFSTITLNETIDISGAKIINQQGQLPDGTELTHTTFNTNEASEDVEVHEDLSGYVTSYYEATNLANISVLNEIKDYASKINCTDFQGKGTIDDYALLFQAASKIATNTQQQMQLNVDVAGFNEFGQAADEMAALFNSFIIKLQSVNIIDDIAFLRSISLALKKIWNLSEVFGRFKKTILATSTVELPQSSHDATELVKNVLDEMNCAMKYMNYFVDPTLPVPTNSALSVVEKNIINTAVDTIDNWSILCNQGVSIAMSNSPDVKYISTANNLLGTFTVSLKKSTSLLKSKLLSYNITY